MDQAKEGPVFVDTSIHIARVVHSEQAKQRIRARLDRHQQSVTGLVPRQEFKRRLLKEAEYLLRLLHRYQSFEEVFHHVIRLPGQWPGRVRKRNICLQTLLQVHVTADDEERTERLQLYLRSLLVNGLRQFDQRVDVLRQDSGCACARVGVVEKIELRKYDLGPDHCSRVKSRACGVMAFLVSRADIRHRILRHLRSLSEEEKTRELRDAEAFLERMDTSTDTAVQEDPCLKVGDLLIALESADVPNFFTLNSAESQHLCRPLGQTLIVRPVNPLEPEVVCAKGDAQWPVFGKRAVRSGDQGNPKGEKS